MNRILGIAVAAACSVVVSSSSFAQGSNSCTTATVISGTGTFAVSTVGATTSSQQSAACVTANRDVWFRWTAASTETMQLSTCGGTSTDTVVAVYAGSACPASGTEIACSDDSCGQQSSCYFPVTSGSSYMIQIGAWSASSTFTGTFTLTPGTDPCGSTIGPDVITGAITNIQNAPAENGLDSFTLGQTSCNIGDAVVKWEGPTPFHPLLCETFYKYEVVAGAGRFEEIGIGWLKHGFAADTGSLCCECQNPLDNQILGVGCSDPYVASQSGTQSSLTPRWQVNVHTGVFPFPGANPPWSGTTARRTEVALADLEPNVGTVRYFGECTYITQDDAQAGNGNNNASWIEMGVSGGPTNFTFSTIGSTHIMSPAIEAWPTLEPGVVLSYAQIPGDGLIIVGSHATSLGGGVWHYEYAVHNMNSDRAIGSFSVPIPSGASITNVGFHDITYRNGDGLGGVNQTSTDWPASVGAGAILWACETQGVNPNANAIRWQGTYNFRFDANVAPTNGSVAFGIWKTGSPGSMSAAAEIPSGPTTIAYCFGDGTGTACPCGNNSAVGASSGCLNSLGTPGTLITAGSASIGGDTFVLHGSGMPDASALYFQGTLQVGGGTGAAFGDGLRCAGGTVIRLPLKTNAGGMSHYPAAGDPPISVIGANVAGNVRTYQCWYRNAATFCAAETFNLTNGVQATWQP
jgi:hypothetical protein